MTTGLELILAERKRQIEQEGFTVAHDAMHGQLELESAAYCYMKANGPGEAPAGTGEKMGTHWPWEMSWWKPKDRLSNLVRAGALYLAGAERADRLDNLMLAQGDRAHVNDVASAIDELLASVSIAHKHDMNHFGVDKWPDGLVPWNAAEPPNLTGGPDQRGTGHLRHCAYCGSMHPADAAAAIRAGAKGEWADRKYGWPHKAYFEGIPNQHAGLLEVRSSLYSGAKELTADELARYPKRVQHGFNPRTGDPEYHYEPDGSPAATTTDGKFYSVHLQDATPADRETIEAHLGLAFEFTDDGRGVRWHSLRSSEGLT